MTTRGADAKVFVVNFDDLAPPGGGPSGGATEATLEAIRVLLDTGTLATDDDASQTILAAIQGILSGTLDVSGAVESSVAQADLPKMTATCGSAGDNTVHTPAAGKKIRLLFFGYSAGANVAGVLVGLRFGAGTVFDRQYLIAPGQPYARNVKAGDGYVEGGVDEPLVVNLDAAQTVYVNIEYEEV